MKKDENSSNDSERSLPIFIYFTVWNRFNYTIYTTTTHSSAEPSEPSSRAILIAVLTSISTHYYTNLKQYPEARGVFLNLTLSLDLGIRITRDTLALDSANTSSMLYLRLYLLKV